MLAMPEPDGTCLHNHWTDSGSDCWMLLGSTPASQRYKVRLCRIRAQEIAHPCESGLYNIGTWRSQNSMAVSSTTAGPILDLIARDCWARRQLRAGIRYVLRRQFPIEL